MGVWAEIKARLVARKVRDMLKNAKKWAILASILLTGAAALASGLGHPGIAEFLGSVLKHANLDPSETGSPIDAGQIGLIVAGLLQVYTVLAKVISDWKKRKAAGVAGLVVLALLMAPVAQAAQHTWSRQVSVDATGSYVIFTDRDGGEAVTWGDHFEVAGRASTLDKTSGGWYAKGWADGCFAHACAGLGYTHRDGGAWTKDVMQLRAGVRFDAARVTASYAWDPDKVLQVWASYLAVVRRPLALRLEGGPSWYQQPGQPAHWGIHGRLLVGIGR